MQKYIDSEKLIGKIEKSKNELKSLMSKLYYAANYKEWEAELNGYNQTLSIITSLQQGQPKMNIPSAGSGAMGTTPPKFKLDVKPVQPEVDLKVEIDFEWAKCNPTDEGMGSEYANISIEQFDALARHFFELGRLNARKEE